MTTVSFSRAIHSYFAHLQPLVDLRSGDWWRMLFDNFTVTEQHLAAADAGNTNNVILRGIAQSAWGFSWGDKPMIEHICNEFTCLGWSGFILHDFDNQRRRGNVPELCMGYARTGEGTVYDEHSFTIIWDRGAPPLVNGIIIDPWPQEAWDWQRVAVIKEHRKPYLPRFNVPEYCEFYDVENNPKRFKRLFPDQRILYEAFCKTR